jgi:site-specific recombinase XerD
MFLTKNNKSAFYQIVYFVDGKRTTHSTKKRNKSEAWQYLEEFRKNLNSPIIESEKEIDQSAAAEHKLTLSQFKEEYLGYMRPIKSKKYIESITISFQQFISICGDLLLDEVSNRIVDKFITTYFAKSQRGAHHYYRTLKAAFNKAIEWNYISSNSFTKVKFPKIPKSFPAFISESELLIILTKTTHQHLKDIFTVAFYTGLRLGELLNMKWSWVNFLQNQITVKCSDEFLTKSKKERIIPICEKVRTVLSRRFSTSLHQPNEYVFYRIKGRKLDHQTISKQFKDAVRETELNEKIHFHSLRHSFASALAQRGVSLFIVKELLGHEDLATTQIYSHLQKQNLLEAVNLL